MVQDAWCRMHGAGCMVQVARLRVQVARCRMHGAGCKVLVMLRDQKSTLHPEP